MRLVELIPGVGAVLDGKTIRLGDARADVEQALGRPREERESTARLNENEFSEEERKALELLGGPDGPVAVIGGANPASAETPLPESSRWYYFDNELRVDFDEEGCVEFIELLGGPDGKLQPMIYGIEAFQTDPEALAALLKEKNSGDFVDNENGYSYAFRTLSVGLYRESIPKNVAEMIEEAEADGHPLSEADIEYEKRRTHWATIGIGAELYYAR